MTKKTKLELTWPGKEDRPALEPRILIEDPAKSYHAAERRDGDLFGNMLIKGDNLLALKALEQDYAGRVQCIYIDPPFNTGEAFEHYEDGLEHSLWLGLMRSRLEILNKLLTASGTIFIHIDDNELGYLIVLADEIFGRKNRISVVSFKQSSVSGPKSRNPGVVSIGSYVLIYAADKSQWKNRNTFRPINRDPRYGQFILNYDLGYEQWKFVPLSQGIESVTGIPYKQWEEKAGKQLEKALDDFVLRECKRVVQLVSVADKDVNENARAKLAESRLSPGVFRSERVGADDYYFSGGKQVAFYKSKVRDIDGRLTTSERISNIWDDLLSNNVHKEGGVRLPNGKKPEGLIKRCLELSTDPGDLVLDSFLGSGTTASVAHKMHRLWIGIELGDQADSLCLPRLKRVVDGSDQDGISKAVKWTGGGGFRYYTLAPSLLARDRWGNLVISDAYNPEMLAEAMCKHLGFAYAPSQDEADWWRHGQSSESDFLYVTTQSVTHDALKLLSEAVGPDRTLMICARAFAGAADVFANVTCRKIPATILTKCEWGRDDYSLNVAALPERAEDVPDAGPLFATGERDRG
ncbi:DNA methyltransferase [Sphingomonas melonis TY]|uniref:site-specific DNA-methyltransferase (adenine-specific) n=1 Tax=Sphingomonas melonis TY TaxID=621456 RepID=A0A175Y2I1_9SPHN|nr:site-specific DNA-methyltransferase [Sphingomonas melonis]AOW22830.1 site-specific DNA-methyltransferase [Sphingomonas melonis TY]KZB94566.1 DNA methyltransferase [Sphingomonas melonis TY]